MRKNNPQDENLPPFRKPFDFYWIIKAMISLNVSRKFILGDVSVEERGIRMFLLLFNKDRNDISSLRLTVFYRTNCPNYRRRGLQLYFSFNIIF